jgi:NAD(P)H-flavin reductase
MVATRMRDTACKRVLRGVPLGAEVQVEGPFGNLILHSDSARAAVFLAGGYVRPGHFESIQSFSKQRREKKS